MICTVTWSRENVLEVEPETSIIRKRKLALVKLVPLQVRPQVSIEVPKRYAVLVVLNVDVDLALVQVAPPFQDNWMQNLGEPVVLFTFPVSFTSIPWMVAALGTLSE